MSKYTKFNKEGEIAPQLSTLEIRSVEVIPSSGNQSERKVITAAVTRTSKPLSPEARKLAREEVKELKQDVKDGYAEKQDVIDFMRNSGLLTTKTTDKVLARITEMKHLFGNERLANARYDVIAEGKAFQGARYSINTVPFIFKGTDGKITIAGSKTVTVMGDTIEACDAAMDFEMRLYKPAVKMEETLYSIKNSPSCVEILEDLYNTHIDDDKRKLTNGIAWEAAKDALIKAAKDAPVQTSALLTQTPPTA